MFDNINIRDTAVILTAVFTGLAFPGIWFRAIVAFLEYRARQQRYREKKNKPITD